MKTRERENKNEINSKLHSGKLTIPVFNVAVT
jgi:hypothetical protein